MDKDEILEKSRSESIGYSDERDKDIKIKSYRWGFAAMGIVCIVLMIVKDSFSFLLPYISGLAALEVYEAFRRKKILDIILAVVAVIMAVASFCVLFCVKKV